ncbi:MAG TPA: metallophosphoesterase family protein [Candidatus Eisenbacteria bacterium]|nr:metallophosphoesterase family protein [Candidatus Eisenbacteria bacterium]
MPGVEITRVAVICDIHGNLPALEAVIEEIRRADVERILIAGDVLPGPMPRETLACLRELDIPFQVLHGNGDREVLAAANGADNPALPAEVRDVVRWVAEQLDGEDRRWIASWPDTLRIEVEGLGAVLACHATPRNDTDVFGERTPEAPLRPLFQDLGVALVVCGHTHMQFDRTIAGVRVVNAGSVGMPYGDAGAYWLLLGPDVRHRRTHYDLEAAAARIRASGYPQAGFEERYVLSRPSREEMDAFIARTELK